MTAEQRDALIVIGVDAAGEHHLRRGAAQRLGGGVDETIEIGAVERDDDAGIGAELARAHRQRADIGLAQIRSEEHTSELQSLMRLSYAVFCLKTKKYTTHTPTDRTRST